MQRHIDLDVVSDGKRYQRSDMVKLGCRDCEGCSSCCHDMESVILDPWDIYMLTTRLGHTAETLLGPYIELGIADGLIILQLRMGKESKACGFLDEAGRCSIHAARPGICRLFPLGRVYEDGKFSYFLQIHECKKENRTKVKIEKWLGIPQLPKYEAYICMWHQFITEFQKKFPGLTEEQQKKQNLLILQELFLKPYEKEAFYPQFEKRMKVVQEILNASGEK